MIDRETVLHVAALSRLHLSEAEVDVMSAELSKVLEHIDTLAELDLEGVKPTAHVVSNEDALRPDVIHESLPREVALSQAPDSADDGFRVPSPQA